MNDTATDISRVTTVIIKISIRLIIYAVVILFLYEGITTGYRFGYEIFNPTAMTHGSGYEKSVVVQDGQSGLEVGRVLKEAGLIRNEYVFAVQAAFYGYDVYPGAYVLNTSLNSREILELMSVQPEEQKGAPGS